MNMASKYFWESKNKFKYDLNEWEDNYHFLEHYWFQRNEGEGIIPAGEVNGPGGSKENFLYAKDIPFISGIGFHYNCPIKYVCVGLYGGLIGSIQGVLVHFFALLTANKLFIVLFYCWIKYILFYEIKFYWTRFP